MLDNLQSENRSLLRHGDENRGGDLRTAKGCLYGEREQFSG